MKKTETNNAYVVIIRGPLGVGKTTISKLLSDKLNGYYVSIDQVLEDNNLDDRPESAECIPVENFIQANEMALLGILDALQHGKKVVVDGNFYHKSALEHLISKTIEFEAHVFTLKSPLEVCVQRDAERENSHGYWPAVAVHNLVSRFDYGICIDTSKQTIEATLALIESHLSAAKGSSTETLVLIEINGKRSYFHPLMIENGFDFPFWRDNEKLWALDVPVEEMSINELEWILDLPQWRDERGYRTLTPRMVLENPERYPEHKQRLEECDTSFAIDIMQNRKGRWLTLDGLHRLLKLYAEGHTIIKVRKIPEELIHLTAKDA